MQHSRKAALFSIIPGFGQFYNRQWAKGAIFVVLTMAYVLAFGDIINMGIWGLGTLGTELPRDNSVFLLAEGILALIVLAFGAVIYYFNIKDAYKNGKKRDENKPMFSFKDQYQAVVNEGYPYLVSGPALILLIFTVIFPILFSFALAFTNYDLYHSPPANLFDWVGLKTFAKIFTVDIWRSTFFDVLGWTIIWTLVATTLQVSIGIFLAVLVNQEDIKFKKTIRTLLVLPWAVPAFVTILIFAGMFNNSFGAINNDILAFFNVSPIPWMTDAIWTRVALITIQGWLGFPYIFVVTTGVLQSIPDDLYEASTLDGASVFQQFKNITLPLILTSMSPIIITQYTTNFNNFNIIYLFNEGNPPVRGQNAGGTDILISWVYKLTFETNNYNMAAAITIIMGLAISIFAFFQFRKTAAFKEEDRY